jgi:hypothetical protein
VQQDSRVIEAYLGVPDENGGPSRAKPGPEEPALEEPALEETAEEPEEDDDAATP